jgi:hypothetical protein
LDDSFVFSGATAGWEEALEGRGMVGELRGEPAAGAPEEAVF